MTIEPDFRKGRFAGRLRAAGIHLAISLTLAILAALLVFVVWYPYPYREISGGRELFLIVVAVDVIMGPLMTLAVFNRRKSPKALGFDLTLIAVLQLVALAYGLWTVGVARPVHLVFEIDRFRVVHAIDIPLEFLNRAPPGLERLPFTGPTLLSVRDFKDNKESFDATMAALQGVAIGTRPDFWQSYNDARFQILLQAHPLADLKTRFPARAGDIDKALKSASAAARPQTSVGYIPMVGRQTFWTVLIDLKTAEVLAFVPIDSF
jgi:hypothetical protein